MTSRSSGKFRSERNSYHTGKWTQEEDDTLVRLVEKYGLKRWKEISDSMLSRSPVQCLHRWTKILKPGLKKGSWMIEEDKKLLEWIKREGPTKWSVCSEYIQGRSGKQCRERWFNTLNPNLKKGNWTPYEDYIICQQYKENGSKWSKMTALLPGRTENSIKNRFYSTLRRISSDIMKTSSKLNNSIPVQSSIANSMNSLLPFFEAAYQEKKALYEQYSSAYSNDSTQKQMSSTMNSMQSEGEEDKDFSVKSREVPRDAPNQLLHGLQFSFEDNTLLGINSLMKQDQEALEKEIVDYFCADFQINEPEIDKIQEKLNKLMGDYLVSTNKLADCEAKKDYSTLYGQLNELEEFLLIAKKKLNQIHFPSEVNDKIGEYSHEDMKEDGERYDSFQLEHFI